MRSRDLLPRIREELDAVTVADVASVESVAAARAALDACEQAHRGARDELVAAEARASAIDETIAMLEAEVGQIDSRRHSLAEQLVANGVIDDDADRVAQARRADVERSSALYRLAAGVAERFVDTASRRAHAAGRKVNDAQIALDQAVEEARLAVAHERSSA